MLILLLAALLAQLHVDWPTYGFTLANTRHVPLRQITPQNVGQLAKVWQFSTGVNGRMEVTPIIVGSTMYVTTGPHNIVIALDAVTGRQKWRYDPKIGAAAACCGYVNRGVAVADGRVFVATLDGRLIALTAANGKPVWDVRIGRAKDGFSETAAPLAWNGIVYVGSSSSDWRVRGSFTAYRASDGKLLWRWYSVGPGWEGAYRTTANGYQLPRDIAQEKRDAARYKDAWKRGGGAVWMTPALDPQSGTILLSTGNPAPYYDGSVRPGDNLYTDCIVALDAHSGRMRWYYQVTPHDLWDYDTGSPPVLFDALDAAGKRVPAVGEAGKVGWLFVLDRRNGKLIRRSQNLVPMTHMYTDPAKHGAIERPGGLGGVIAPLSLDPARHLAYLVTLDRPEYRHPVTDPTFDPKTGMYEAGDTTPTGSWTDSLIAVNVDNGKITWRQKLASGPILGHYGGRVVEGSLSVGDLVFASDPEGSFSAFDASTGEAKWHYQLGANAAQNMSPWSRFIDWMHAMKGAMLRRADPPAPLARVDASPVVYAIDGREYIAIGADLMPESSGGTSAITVFALPQP